MSKNGTATGDQRIIAALHHTGGVWRAVVGQRSNGDVTLIDSREFARPESHHIDTWLDQHQAGRVVVALPAGSVICRTVELPNAEVEQLAPALALQMETFLGETAPPHRRGMAVLDRAEGESTRSGLLTAWPPRAAGPEPPTERPVDFASDIAGIAALVNGVRASDPVMWVDRGDDSIALAMAHPQGVAFRASREPGGNPAEWRAGISRLLAETAYNIGHSEDFASDVISRVEPWIADVPAGAGRLHLPRPIQDRARERMQGVPDDPNWWATFGVAAGILLAATGTLSGLTTLAEEAPVEKPTFLDRVAGVIGTRKAAVFLLIAALLLIGMGPLTFSGLRLFALYSKVGDLEEFRRTDADRESRLRIYTELGLNTWSMSKLLADIGNCAPPGVVFNSIDLDESSNKVQVRGEADSQQVVIDMADAMRASRIFSEVAQTYSERDQGKPQFTITAQVIDAFHRNDWGENDYAVKTLVTRLYPEAARVEVDPGELEESGEPTATQPPFSNTDGEETPVRTARNENVQDGGGRTGPRIVRPQADIPSVITEEEKAERERGQRTPELKTADEIAQMDRQQTIAAMVTVRNAMQLPRLDEDQQKALREQFEAMAEHLRNLPR